MMKDKGTKYIFSEEHRTVTRETQLTTVSQLFYFLPACTTKSVARQTQTTISAEWLILSHINRFVQERFFISGFAYSLELIKGRPGGLLQTFRREAVKIPLALVVTRA